jgi:serine protease Do
MKRIIVLITLVLVCIYLTKTEEYLHLPQLKLPWDISQQKAEFIQHDNIRVLNEESAVIGAIEKAIPSVVTISISKTTRTPDRIQINPFNPSSPFETQPGEDRTFEGNIGSGFAIASNLVVTNKHVVADSAGEYKVISNDEKAYEIESISRDPLNDLAIIRLKKAELKPITLGNSDTLKLGQAVIAIGTPLGEFTNTVTTGIVSGLGRGITAGSPLEGYVERLDNVIQTDAAINPGNSGGPLLNSVGEVIGVNTAVSQGSQNIGFAIPVNVVRDVVENFNDAGGKIARPFMGIRYQMISKENAILNEIPEGAYVREVVAKSPAATAGIKAGDVITQFDGVRVRGKDETALQKLIASQKVGASVQVVFWRDGKSITKTLELDPFE